jgi:predicted ArsR family transcriptional regulator
MKVKRLDGRDMKVLAHPLRVQIVSSLRREGPATATVLADRLDESSGLTSYHLRILAAAGFVEDDPDHPATGRERWWRAAHDITSWTPADAGEDPESRAAEDWLVGFTARQSMEWLDGWLRRRSDAEPEWRQASETNDYFLDLTPAELQELLQDLHAVVQDRVERAPSEGARQVRLLLHAFPS